MKQLLTCLHVLLLLTAYGCGEPERRVADGSTDRTSDRVPVSEIWGDADDEAAVDEEEEEQAEADRDAIVTPPPSTQPHPQEVQQAGEQEGEPDVVAAPGVHTPEENAEGSDADAQPTPAAIPRSIRVATWHPPDVETPEWIHPAIRAVHGGRRMFGRYNGDYKRYTADVIREIRRTHSEGQPVILVLQHWLNRAHYRSNDPSSIDRFGLFTHIDDRTEAGLPGIWPKAGLEFWREANDYLFRNLKEAGVNVDFVALDTELTPHGRAGVYSLEGTFEAIVNDPRWHSEPLLGFDGKTAADLIPNPPLDNFRLLWGALRLIGRQVFTAATNETLTDRVLAYFPDAMISDYNMFAQVRTEETEERQVHVDSLRIITDALGTDRLVLSGVGNTASPSYYGQTRWGKWAEVDEDASRIDAMLAHAELLVEAYGPDRVAPWIISRERMSRGSLNITEEMYMRWIQGLVDLGIKRFMWFPGGRSDSIADQRLTVRAFEEAVKSVDSPVDP